MNPHCLAYLLQGSLPGRFPKSLSLQGLNFWVSVLELLRAARVRKHLCFLAERLRSWLGTQGRTWGVTSLRRLDRRSMTLSEFHYRAGMQTNKRCCPPGQCPLGLANRIFLGLWCRSPGCVFVRNLSGSIVLRSICCPDRYSPVWDRHIPFQKLWR
jgi:hypothetical protein